MTAPQLDLQHKLAPHRECPGCGRQQYLALSGWWTHCLADADASCPPAWRA